MHFSRIRSIASFKGARIAGAVLGLGLVFATLNPVSASSVHGPTIQTLYNRTLADFNSLLAVASQHNSFANHRSSCGAEKGKSWTHTAQKDMSDVKGVVKALQRMSSAAKKTSAFHDMQAAAQQVKKWGQSQIVKHLGSCKHMPTQSNGIQNALHKVGVDLGISGGY